MDISKSEDKTKAATEAEIDPAGIYINAADALLLEAAKASVKAAYELRMDREAQLAAMPSMLEIAAAEQISASQIAAWKTRKSAPTVSVIQPEILAATPDAKPKVVAARWQSVGNQAQAHTPVQPSQSQAGPAASPEALQKPKDRNKSEVNEKEEQKVARPKPAEENPTHPYTKGREQLSTARSVGKVVMHMAFGITGGYVVNKLIGKITEKKEPERNIQPGNRKITPKKIKGRVSH